MRWINLLLALAIIAGLIITVRWYVRTPQPPSLMGQIDYMRDTAEFEWTKQRTEIPQDIAKQIAIWEPMAKDNNSVAQIEMARLLFRAASQNTAYYKPATTYLLSAANKGIPRAQNALGVAYRDGLGVQADKMEAYKWFSLASDRGMKLADKNMLSLSHEMNSNEILSAEQLADAWLVNYQAEGN